MFRRVVPAILLLAGCSGELTSPRTTQLLAGYHSWTLESVDGAPLPLTVDSSAASRERLTDATLTIDPTSLNPIGPRVVSMLEVLRTGQEPVLNPVIDPLAYSVSSDSTFTIQGQTYVAGTAHLRADGSLVVESGPTARYGARVWRWRAVVSYPPD